MFVKFTSLFHIGKICEIFRNLINRLENIANMHHEHDVFDFFKHRPKHRGRCFFPKTSAKNRIVKNWKTSHR